MCGVVITHSTRRSCTYCRVFVHRFCLRGAWRPNAYFLDAWLIVCTPENVYTCVCANKNVGESIHLGRRAHCAAAAEQDSSGAQTVCINALAWKHKQSKDCSLVKSKVPHWAGSVALKVGHRFSCSSKIICSLGFTVYPPSPPDLICLDTQIEEQELEGKELLLGWTAAGLKCTIT